MKKCCNEKISWLKDQRLEFLAQYFSIVAINDSESKH